MTAEDNKAMVRRYIEEVWNGHDLDAIDELVSPEYLNHAASTAEYQRGGDKHIMEWLLSVFPDHRFDIEDAAADGDTVAGARHVHRHPRGRALGHPADGQAFRRPAVALVPRLGGQGGRALGGEGRPGHDEAAGRFALITRPIHPTS
jgi:predicted ester cyclase